MSGADGSAASLVRRLERRHWESLFFLVLLSYTVVLVARASQYGSQPRLFPLVIGVTLIALILVRITMLLSDRFSVAGGGMFESLSGLTDDEEETQQRDTLARYRIELSMVGWVLALLALIWALGFQLALVVFVFAFVYVYERSAPRAVATAVLSYALIYLLFVQLLSVTLYEPNLLPDFIVELIP